MKTIASAQNPKLKAVAELQSHPREIRAQKKTVLEGAHLIEEALALKLPIAFGLVSSSALQHPEREALVSTALGAGVEWFQLEDVLFQKLSDTVSPQGMLAVVSVPDPRPLEADSDFVLLLEDIQDPGNLGTLIRSARAAGVDAILLSKGSAEAWAPKVLRAGMGGHFSMNILQGMDLIAFTRTWGPIAATTLGGTPLWQADWAVLRGIALGNEGAGLSQALRAACQSALTIPMAPGVESLNAAVAGSVVLFERQRVLTRR